MAEKGKKKKWYETWWGLLWTLALVDANPGRGLQVFMDVDKELHGLADMPEDESVWKPAKSYKPRRASSCPAGAANCKI